MQGDRVSRRPRLGVAVSWAAGAGMLAVAAAGPVPAASAQFTCEGEPATIIGSTRGGSVWGTSRRDVIVTFGGSDVIRASAGDDLVCAGGGDDLVYGSFGDDVLHGQDGDDRLRGQADDDAMYGGNGDDELLDVGRHHIADGGPGIDTCSAGMEFTFSCERLP